MTLKELQAELQKAYDILKQNNIDEDEIIDLDILILQIKRQMIVASWDPLKELSGISAVDISKLPGLVSEVEIEIKNGERRVKLIRTIVGVAKNVLSAAGFRRL